MPRSDTLTGNHLAWRVLGAKVVELRGSRSRELLNKRYGIGTDTLRRIEKSESNSVSRSTLTLLSFIFDKRPDYLENVLKGLSVDDTPAFTVGSAEATLQDLAETLGSIRADAQRYLDVLRQSSPTIASEIATWQHEARVAAEEPSS